MVNNKQKEIVQVSHLLQLAYPDANRSVLTLSDLYQLITKLPDYQTWSRPSDKELQAILWQWMRQAGE